MDHAIEDWVKKIAVRDRLRFAGAAKKAKVAGKRRFPMLKFRRAIDPSPNKWKRIEETPIPLSLGRIWLVDKDGNITRALAYSQTARAT
jgi:hypothetical protein